MPLYTSITRGSLPDDTKARIAEELTRIHCEVMKVPAHFVHVIFLSYPKGFGYSGGKEAPATSLNCVLRSGHTVEEKTDLLKQYG
jgi:phenylpyruvate tautomerase PptA (4-oxalocrotonate tautomerase family)